MRTLPDNLDQKLRDLLGPAGCLAPGPETAPYEIDWRKLYPGRAALVLRPQTTAEVAGAVALCATAGVAIVPQGGNSSLCGGSTPSPEGDQIVLSLTRLNRLRRLDRENATIAVDAGMILQQVQQAAAEAGLLFPLSLGAEGSCQIGGNIATNAGGIAVLRYGNMRDLVLGIEAVLPNGEIWDGMRALRKDNTGYDLKQLFIGSEGTLGIVTGAVLKLFPQPSGRVTAMLAVRDLDAAIDLLGRCRTGCGDAVTGYEWIPRATLDLALAHVPGIADPLADRPAHYLLVELSRYGAGADLRLALEGVLEAALEDGLVQDATIAESQAQTQRLWHMREAIVEAQRVQGASVKHDIAVPLSSLAQFVARATQLVTQADPQILLAPFGHLGDGNLHFNLCQPPTMTAAVFLDKAKKLTPAIHDLTMAMAGSISAEHGLGRLRRDEILRYKSVVEIEMMRRLKRALDPRNIMNPGKVILP